MPQILFRNASLIDTEAGRTLPSHSVLVEDERIVELREGEIRAPEAQAIDVGGRTLMPGLIDAHVHAAITTMNLAAMAQRPLTLVTIEAAKAAGVPMGFGTDLLGETHEQQSREFSIRAQVLSPAEILHSATVVNAEILNRSDELGVIAPGALADLLVVDGDPLEDLSLLEEQGQHLAVIMKGGRLFVNRLS